MASSTAAICSRRRGASGGSLKQGRTRWAQRTAKATLARIGNSARSLSVITRAGALAIKTSSFLASPPGQVAVPGRAEPPGLSGQDRPPTRHVFAAGSLSALLRLAWPKRQRAAGLDPAVRPDGG